MHQKINIVLNFSKNCFSYFMVQLHELLSLRLASYLIFYVGDGKQEKREQANYTDTGIEVWKTLFRSKSRVRVLLTFLKQRLFNSLFPLDPLLLYRVWGSGENTSFVHILNVQTTFELYNNQNNIISYCRGGKQIARIPSALLSWSSLILHKHLLQ